MRILILTRYGRRGASSRYRFFDFLPYFQAVGHDVSIQSLFDDAYVMHIGKKDPLRIWRFIKAFWKRIFALFSLARIDLIVLEKEVFPYFPHWIEIFFRFLNRPYIVDFDDAIFHQYDQHRSKVIRAFFASKISRVMHGSVLVVAGSSYLASYALKAGAPQVKIIPTTIRIGRYPSEPCLRKSGIFTVVWIGSPSTTRYLHLITTALEKICAPGRGRLRLIGASNVSLPNIDCEYLDWSEETEIELMRQAHVGIMPLPDTPWEQGKCGFKLIQYMGCHLPVVASPVGVNRDIVDQGVNGFLASTTEAWVEALEYLRDRPDHASTIGSAGRKKAEEQYSLEVWGPQYVSMLEGL